MGAKMDEAIKVSILIASMEVAKLSLVTAAFKPLPEAGVMWETVSERLI